MRAPPTSRNSRGAAFGLSPSYFYATFVVAELTTNPAGVDGTSVGGLYIDRNLYEAGTLKGVRMVSDLQGAPHVPLLLPPLPCWEIVSQV